MPMEYAIKKKQIGAHFARFHQSCPVPNPRMAPSDGKTSLMEFGGNYLETKLLLNQSQFQNHTASQLSILSNSTMQCKWSLNLEQKISNGVFFTISDTDERYKPEMFHSIPFHKLCSFQLKNAFSHIPDITIGGKCP